MITGITLIILSLIAVPSLILSKKPDAQKILDKIAPYQGWIGLLFCFWGIYGVVFSGVFGLGWFATWPIFWVTTLLVNIMQAVLGFLLGYGMISRLVFAKSEEAQKKGAALLAKLSPMQGKLGLAGLAVGAWCIVASFLFYGV